MKISIREKEYEYISDYPNGWNFAARDHFKFPVMIGNNGCFIKRFERKSLEDISGWHLLINLRGKNEHNLPRVHDIVGAKERDRDVYYVFFESLQGDTLENLIKKTAELNLEKLTEDLFKALQSIHVKNYWFTSFNEKNIFCEKGGRFLLVDLDSTQPTSELPDMDTIGKNNYWNLILNFYREILHQRNFNPNDINGSTLNYLQAVFLILRLKLFYSDNEEYYSDDLYKRLPGILNGVSPSFKEIYTNVYRNRELAIQSRDIEKIKMLTLQILQKEKLSVYETTEVITEKKPESFENKQQPVIHHFAISNYGPSDDGIYFVNNGKPFDVTWNVQDATGIELFRNGAPYLALNNSQKSIELKEFSDGKKSAAEYKLVATGSSGRSASSIIRIHIKAIPADEPILAEPVHQQPEIPEPTIEHFTISNYAKKTGEEYVVNSSAYFILSWKVKHADTLEIYKNEEFYKQLDPTAKNIELKETYDGQEKRIIYTLRASNEYALSISEPLNLHVVLKKNEVARPEIINFEASNYIVENEEAYTLSWTVKNVTSLDLYRNKKFYKKINPADKNIQLREVFEGKETKAEYRLITLSDADEIKSEPLVINLKQRVIVAPFDWSLYIKIGSIVLGIILIFLLATFIFSNIKPDNNIRVNKIEPQNLYEDSSITIYGEKFNNSKKLEVYFNDVKGKVLSSANDKIKVEIPDLKNNILVKGDITVTVKANGYDIYSHHFLWFDKNAFTIKNIKTTNFYKDSTITVYYHNLRDLGTVKVYFNYIKGIIKYQHTDSVIVNVPENILADTVQHSITINVKDGIKTIYTYNFTP